MLCVFSGFLAGVAFSQTANINLSNTLLFEGEPYLAINPTNHQNMVVGWMALDASTAFRMGIKTKVSFDGGNTWGNEFVQPHLGSAWHSADVSMKFRPNGTLYLCYIDYHESPDSGGVYITHSADGGVTWSSPSQVWNALSEDPSKLPLDRPWLAIDNSGTANDGEFYVTTKPAPWILPPNRPYLKTSSNSGATWSAYRYIDTVGSLVGSLIAAPMPAPEVTSDGALCIAYPSYLASQSIYPRLILAKSYNKGLSFQYYDMLLGTSGVQDTLYKVGYHLAANPNNANQLAFVFIATPNGDPDVFLITTQNGGTSWNGPVRVNDDVIGNGKAQDLPWVTYDNHNKLLVTWRDRRNGSGTGFFQPSDSYGAVSTDNGNSFLPNLRLSNITAPFDSILEQNGNDFMSCEYLNDTIYAVWGDVRTGNLNIFFAKTSGNTGSGISPKTIETQPLMQIYPNPAQDRITVFLAQAKFSRGIIKIINEEGREVFSLPLNTKSEHTMDVSALAKGSYLVQLFEEGVFIAGQKLIISK